MHSPLPLVRDLVLVGGGHAHALVLRRWAMAPVAGVRLTLINPGPTAPYSGMLPGHVAGHYSREELDIDLVRLARVAGARLILAPATGIDPDSRLIEVEGRVPIGYDLASIDIGIHAEMPAIPGFAEHAVGAKPLDIYAARWRAFLARARAGEIAPDVAVIGGGVAGVELALAMAHALRAAPTEPRVTVIEAGEGLAGLGRGARRRLTRALHAHGVRMWTGASIRRIEAERVVLDDGRDCPSAFTVGVAGAHAHPWLATTPLPLTTDGFILTGPDLRVQGHENLFAVGDCAHMPHAPRPKAGVYAVRAAPVLYDNLVALLTGGRTRPFRPQRDFLKLISLGEKAALAEKWGLALSGPLLWRWKDRIDRRFMEKFRDLPKMPAPPLPKPAAKGLAEELAQAGHGTDRAGQPLCGGCGAKVAPAMLGQTLAELGAGTRDDLLTGPGDDAAVLRIGGRLQVLTTDHLRAFTPDHGLLARIAVLHALGDIWAMGAVPQAALISVILPRMSAPLQRRSMDEILQAADDVLSGLGAAIAGGHSTMGAELTIGATLTGLVEGGPITLKGARPGDRLILTRPLGSGTLLAAEMQGRADGRDIAHLFDVLTRPQADAARLLAPAARAMTDVTGFGLAGHLLALCRESGVGAELALAAIPLFPGALELAKAGLHSTLHAANLQAAPVIGLDCLTAAEDRARATLLHDPQTAGGLLAAVDAAEAPRLVDALQAAGHEAAEIGRILPGAPRILLG